MVESPRTGTTWSADSWTSDEAVYSTYMAPRDTVGRKGKGMVGGGGGGGDQGGGKEGGGKEGGKECGGKEGGCDQGGGKDGGKGQSGKEGGEVGRDGNVASCTGGKHNGKKGGTDGGKATMGKAGLNDMLPLFAELDRIMTYGPSGHPSPGDDDWWRADSDDSLDSWEIDPKLCPASHMSMMPS